MIPPSSFTKNICGIDEAGRGPLAGPVVAACVYIPEKAAEESFWQSVTDSKKLTAARRDALFSDITDCAAYGIGQASVEEIDSLNIHHATLLAMKRAFEAMESAPDALTALIDGKFAPALPCPAVPVIKGDSLHTVIGAASILAKVTRDRIMADLHKDFPVYGWDRNAAYGTAEHLEALRVHGITPHHRRSFAPVKALAA